MSKKIFYSHDLRYLEGILEMSNIPDEHKEIIIEALNVRKLVLTEWRKVCDVVYSELDVSYTKGAVMNILEECLENKENEK